MKIENRLRVRLLLSSGIFLVLFSLLYPWFSHPPNWIMGHYWSTFGGLLLATAMGVWWFRIHAPARGGIAGATRKAVRRYVPVLLGIVCIIGSFSLAWSVDPISDVRLWFLIWTIGLLGGVACAWALNYAWYNRPSRYCSSCGNPLHYVKENSSLYCYFCGEYTQIPAN